MPQTLVQTRFCPPRLPGGVSPRPRLNNLLSPARGCKLLLINAPAGYGKTTAVLLWTQQQQLPVGWLALDAEHDDLLGPYASSTG